MQMRNSKVYFAAHVSNVGFTPKRKPHEGLHACYEAFSGLGLSAPLPNVATTTWSTCTPERGARKQFIYNISGFYSGFGAVFPGIEVSRSTLL